MAKRAQAASRRREEPPVKDPMHALREMIEGDAERRFLRGESAPGQRPVIAGRVTAELHRKIKEAAAKSGRSMSEEMAWRAEQSFQWEAAFGDAQKLLSETRQTSDENLKARLRAAGYQPVHDINGTIWLSPGMEIGKFSGAMNPAIEEAIERAVLRAMQKAQQS